MDLPEKLAILAVTAAAISLVVFGGILSASAFLLCGFMGWTRTFEQGRAQGKPTLSDPGRIAVAAILASAGVLFLPLGDEAAQKPDQPAARAFGKMEAIDACKEGVVARAAHPSTVEFPVIDYDFREYAEDKSQLLMSAKARNGFNLLIEFDVQCDFTNERLDEVIMTEASPA